MWEVERMIYHKFGKTDLQTSAIGFGGMRFRQNEGIEACAEVVKAAYERGINFFDTAPGYGLSEEIFGAAFKQMNKQRSKRPFYVSTKSLRINSRDIRSQLETSLKRMNVDYLDFYHVWYVLSLDEYKERKRSGVLKTFERLKDEGLIKHISISTHATGDEIEKILSDYPFDSVLLGYSAMNFAYRQQGLDAAVKQNCAVAVMNPLGGGLIAENPDKFSFLKTKKEETVVEAAIRFLLNDKRINIVLAGFSTISQIDEAIKAADGFEPLKEKDIKRITEGIDQTFNKLCTGCRYCDVCPQKIDVPKIMDAYNHLMLGKSDRVFLERLQMHWGYEIDKDFLSECTACAKCQDKCTQKLPVCKQIAAVRSAVQKLLSKKT